MSSVDHFLSNLSATRRILESRIQLQQVEVPEVMEQLSSPLDYTAAGERELRPLSNHCLYDTVIPQNLKIHLLKHKFFFLSANNSELVERLEGVASVWTNQMTQVLTESEQMRKEADDVGPSAELEHWKRRMVKFDRLLVF